MKTKHKLAKDFQFISADKKIFILKAGTILEEYNYRTKSETIPIDKDIVDQNPDYFLTIDWKSEFLSHMKANKLPQPAQLAKKLIPFIEEMVLSAAQAPPQDGRELTEREAEVARLEKRLAEREEEIEIRMKRLEKRDSDHREDLKELERKEDSLRERSREISEKRLELEDYAQDLNERERNLANNALKSSSEIDTKYADLQRKIEIDLSELSKKESNLESVAREISKREAALAERENEMQDRLREIEEVKSWEEDLRRLDAEIKSWESLHWKLKRNTRPPSAIG